MNIEISILAATLYLFGSGLAFYLGYREGYRKGYRNAKKEYNRSNRGV
jgi:hypothetical protein